MVTRELGLELNRKKTLIRNVAEGFPFLGVFVTPHAEFVGTRAKSNFAGAIAEFTRRHPPGGEVPSRAELERFRSAANSYLGLMGRSDSYRLRQKLAASSASAFPAFAVADGYAKIVLPAIPPVQNP